MVKRFPLHPPHPERNCWGCDRYCKAGDMLCGNGSSRTQHPMETLGPDWAECMGFTPEGSPCTPATTDPHEAHQGPTGALMRP